MDVEPTQPVDQFIVKVKLLTNEVFEFVIKPEQTKVSQLKQMIVEKINIPLERQRIVFGGKQLVDDNKVSEYGMTVHLIAKMGGQQTTSTNTTTTTQSSNQQQSSTQNNQTGQTNEGQVPPPPPLPNPFGNLLRGMGLGNPQATTMTFTNMGDLNQGLGGILGSLGIRLPPQPPQQNNQQGSQQRTQANTHNNPFQTPPSNRPSQQQTQPTSSFTSNVPQPATQPSQQTQPNQQFNVSNEPILRLNQTISSLNLPSEPVLDNSHLSLREQTAQYLRRLQHQYMRMIPQLNRSIQLLNQGRVTHLGQVQKLFQAIDQANEHAELAIERLLNLPANQQQTQSQQNITVQQHHTSNQPNSQSNQPAMEVENVQIEVENSGSQEQPVNANIQATIIIQEDDIDLDDEGSTINQATRNQQSQPNPRIVNSATFNLGNDLGGLAGLLGSLTGQPPAQSQSNTQPPMMGGLNLGGLMSMFGGLGAMNPQQNRPQQPNQQPTQQTTQPQQQAPHVHSPQCNHQHQPPQQPSQQPQQMPFDIGNLASMASMMFNQPPQQVSQQSIQQPSNPFGGFNLGSIFSQLQESGGVGEIMSMSLGQTIEEGTGAPTIYSAILRSFTGSDILSCFTSKNFDFLDTKYDNVRENFLHAISIAGSQEDLVQSISQDFANLIVPKGQVIEQEKTISQATDIIRQHVAQIARLTMSKGDSKYSEVVLQHLKRAFCESIHHVIKTVNPSALTNGQSATNLVFNNLKARSIELMDDFIQGLSGMFYGFIERDFIRVYNEFLAQEKRKQQRSAEQIQNEEELLKRIQTQSKKDVEYLKNFKHSEFYNQKSE